MSFQILIICCNCRKLLDGTEDSTAGNFGDVQEMPKVLLCSSFLCLRYIYSIGYAFILTALDLYCSSTTCKCITLDDFFQPNVNKMLMFLKALILKKKCQHTYAHKSHFLKKLYNKGKRLQPSQLAPTRDFKTTTYIILSQCGQLKECKTH